MSKARDVMTTAPAVAAAVAFLAVVLGVLSR